MRLRTLRLVGLMGFAVLLTVPGVGVAGRKPVVAFKPSMLRTYRFTAKIIHNTGVTPLRVGTHLTGQFTYSLKASQTASNLKWVGHYRSAKIKIRICYGKLVFSSQDVGWIKVTSTKDQRGLYVGGANLKLPKGWQAKANAVGTRKSSCGFSLQDRGSNTLLPNTSIPSSLAFWKRFETCTVRLDFSHGVRFPGGGADRHAAAFAKVESLERVYTKRHRSKKGS